MCGSLEVQVFEAEINEKELKGLSLTLLHPRPLGLAGLVGGPLSKAISSRLKYIDVYI